MPSITFLLPRRVRTALSVSFLGFSVCLGALLAACNGCRNDGKGKGVTVQPEPTSPTVRIYVLTDLAGALEPCGCQKDMLGGLDHFAAYVSKEQQKAPRSMLAAVGPVFYEDDEARPDHTDQDAWKAEALASGLKNLGLAAFTPGKNDWSQGGPSLGKLRDTSSGALVAANLSGEGAAGAVSTTMREVEGVKVAFVGVATPKNSKGAPTGVNVDEAAKALSAAAKKARSDGARIVVGLAAIDRGDAVRAAEQTPDLDMLAIGSPSSQGDANTDAKPPRFVGNVLVVEPSNHLTRVAVVDFFVRGDGRFADGSGLERAAEIADLTLQITGLEKSIAIWEKDPAQPKSDVDTQKKRLADMKAKLEKAKAPPPTPAGSFLRYDLVEVRQAFGSDEAAKKAMGSYYQRVNATNKAKFAGKKAPVPAKGEAQYVGVDVCKTCHASAFDVWSKTKHGHAYETLSKDSKEFNLDCVSCHVTGYDKPGGSSVTDVDVLKSVQCEQCHGPGSAHVADPYSSAIPVKKPEESVCTGCHHAPHTDTFVFEERIEKITGPGHGKPGAPVDVDPPKGWKPPALRFP